MKKTDNATRGKKARSDFKTANVQRDSRHNGRISAKFLELESKNQKALVTYAMAGFPSTGASESAILGMIRGGADIVEIGFPFSDPLADGAAIQEASAESLKGNMTFTRLLRMVKRIRIQHPDVPLVLMTYANVLYNIGYEKAIKQISDFGIDGIILPDMSVDESASYIESARRFDCDTIFLASPNTSAARLKNLVSASSGFIYAVAVYGTTGARKSPAGSKKTAEIPSHTAGAIRRIRRTAHAIKLPVGVGFGVSTPADVSRYARAGADAVIVGSAYIDVIRKAPRGMIESRVAQFTRHLKASTHRQ